MHPRDRDRWRAIDANEREPTWADLIGDPAGATYLSHAGRELIPRMATDLEAAFKNGWVGRALRSDGNGRIQWLGRFAPPLSVFGEQGAAGAFVELVRWWAAVVGQASQPGMGQVRNDLQRDVSITRLLHTLTQTRLGAIASTLGMNLRYEPRPGDVLIDDGTTQVTVEVFAMRAAPALEQSVAATDRCADLLHTIGRENGVYFTGTLPHADQATNEWVDRVTRDAATAARLGISISIDTEGHELVVTPGEAPEGSSLDGPAVEMDVGARLLSKVRAKAAQVGAADTAWLWLENHGVVDRLVPIYTDPLACQLTSFQTHFAGVTRDAPTVAGLTFSTAGRRTNKPVERVELAEGSARCLEQKLPLDRVRTTFHLPAHPGSGAAPSPHPASDLMWRLVESEQRWLDIALDTMEVPGGVSALLREDLRDKV